MPLKVKKQPRETSQGLIQRFTKKLKRSGILFGAREKMFYRKPKSGQLKKRSALRRVKKQAEYKRLKKFGVR